MGTLPPSVPSTKTPSRLDSKIMWVATGLSLCHVTHTRLATLAERLVPNNVSATCTTVFGHMLRLTCSLGVHL